jgi:hypothetical protein
VNGAADGHYSWTWTKDETSQYQVMDGHSTKVECPSVRVKIFNFEHISMWPMLNEIQDNIFICGITDSSNELVSAVNECSLKEEHRLQLFGSRVLRD